MRSNVVTVCLVQKACFVVFYVSAACSNNIYLVAGVHGCWVGVFVDLFRDDVDDKSVLRILIEKAQEVCVCVCSEIEFTVFPHSIAVCMCIVKL